MVNLEGPFYGTDMNSEFNVPFAQPYNTSPWNYAGTEFVSTIPADVVDWILIELRDAPNASEANLGTILDQKAGFILNNGEVVDIDGTSILNFEVYVDNNLFVVVYHRNHLPVMSANPLVLSGGTYTYDFTTDISKAYNSGQKLIGAEAALYSGDANADGSVNSSDKSLWNTLSGNSGYLPEDYNMDGQVNNPDKNDLWVPNEGEGSQVPE